MTLTNLLQLINDLNPNYKIYLRIKKQDYPLAKIKVGANNCQLLSGKSALNIRQLIQLVKNLHRRGIPLQIINDEKSTSVYGIQISLENFRIILI